MQSGQQFGDRSRSEGVQDYSMILAGERCKLNCFSLVQA